MCYGYGCGNEDRWGQCKRGRGVPCPATEDTEPEEPPKEEEEDIDA